MQIQVASGDERIRPAFAAVAGLVSGGHHQISGLLVGAGGHQAAHLRQQRSGGRRRQWRVQRKIEAAVVDNDRLVERHAEDHGPELAVAGHQRLFPVVGSLAANEAAFGRRGLSGDKARSHDRKNSNG